MKKVIGMVVLAAFVAASLAVGAGTVATVSTSGDEVKVARGFSASRMKLDRSRFGSAIDRYSSPSRADRRMVTSAPHFDVRMLKVDGQQKDKMKARAFKNSTH
ncbi:MAG: hypothetical protein IT350_06400 [Deltaproteobacteria bacterium]|nr:hypothetical protein [Deltaproteobacteria bacterium]